MFNVTIKPDNGESYDIKITMKDAVKWEKADKGRNITHAQEEGLRLADIYELAFYAAVRIKKFKGDLDKFENTNDLSFEADDQDLDTTSQDQH